MWNPPALLAAALVATAAWTGHAQPASKIPPAHQREAVPAKVAAAPQVTDAQMEAIIRAKLAKSKIAADKFTVRVQGGVATFEGRTEVVQHKGTATRMAKTAGAVAVNNHIQISDTAKAKASQNLESGRRRAQVKRGDARSQADQPRQAR